MSDKEGNTGPAERTATTPAFVDKLQEQWQKSKEHAETYPYVWGSYILVYSGLGLYLTWRYRKLRRTEERVRVLQERLKKLVEADEPKNPPSPSPSPQHRG